MYGGVFGDALRASSVRGHHTIVAILLKHGASIEHLSNLLGGADGFLSQSLDIDDKGNRCIEVLNSGLSNTDLALEMKSALDTGASASHFAALVKQAYFQLRSYETKSWPKQAATVTRPHLDRLRKLVKQAVQSDFGRHPHNPQSRFYNAAMEIRVPPMARS